MDHNREQACWVVMVMVMVMAMANVFGSDCGQRAYRPLEESKVMTQNHRAHTAVRLHLHGLVKMMVMVMAMVIVSAIMTCFYDGKLRRCHRRIQSNILFNFLQKKRIGKGDRDGDGEGDGHLLCSATFE